MTTPERPGQAIVEAGKRVQAQRDATRQVSQEIADRRAQEAEAETRQQQ
jgi:hypothetical protein